LSSLERIYEGKFHYQDEKSLDPLKYIDIKPLRYTGDKLWIQQGKKINQAYLPDFKSGLGAIVFDDFFAIVGIDDNKVRYILNDIRCAI
jgi:tRNA pseudouridine55 synthase